MILTVKPSTQLKGKVQLPASKSYSIRAFMIAACGGTSQILHPSDCDDALVAKAVAKTLGAKIARKGKNQWSLKVPGHVKIPSKIHVRESGTVLRFVLPLLAYHGQSTKITGERTLRGRPNYHLTRALRRCGVDIRGNGTKESIPIKLNKGSLKGGRLSIDGSISSQFISALLITAPLLEEDTRLSLKGKLVSTDYITMTLQFLRKVV